MDSQQPSAEATSLPRIFLLSLETEAFFDEMYKDLIDSLLSKAKVQRARKLDPALRYLSEYTPDAIFATDAALLKTKYATVLEKVISYVRRGGTIVFGATFSSFAKPDHLNRFFEFSWGLPWKAGSYHRTTVHVNTNCQGLSMERLQTSYSQKALYLKNVPPESRLYAADEESTVESHVFYPEPINDLTQAAIVFAPYESGRIGYIGDVNGEDGSHAVILAMCKL
ncbi:Transcription factor [Trichophyton interdigitale]|nr:Transcription factor [Trichophyton interdigitale]KAG5217438.1 Transcription factor [Trichophyton interdigitale]KAG8205949.1 Transcription factor [Trichophyton interdigitale]